MLETKFKLVLSLQVVVILREELIYLAIFPCIVSQLITISLKIGKVVLIEI